MQDFDGKPPESQEENAIRRKETVLIRQTSQGWVEVDEAKEEELKEQKAAEDAAAGLQPKEDIVQDVNTEGSESEVKQPDEASRPSTQAQWQAFASNTPAETGIQVSS